MSILLEKYFNKLWGGRSAKEGSYAEGLRQNQPNQFSHSRLWSCLRPQGCDKLRSAIDRRLGLGLKLDRSHRITSLKLSNLPKFPMPLQLRVYVPPHPLIKHWLAVARDAATPSVLFRSAMTELGRWLAYEAIRDWLPTVETTVQTPLGESPATFINPQAPLCVVPILRAGLALLEGIQTVVPLASVYHLGMARNEETLEPTCYLNKLPAQFNPETRVIISEPMLATGGTIVATMQELTARGIDSNLIRIISVVAAPPALKRLSAEYPSLTIYTATIDETVNEQGFIVPGLGDAGDRTYGT